MSTNKETNVIFLSVSSCEIVYFYNLVSRHAVYLINFMYNLKYCTELMKQKLSLPIYCSYLMFYEINACPLLRLKAPVQIA